MPLDMYVICTWYIMVYTIVEIWLFLLLIGMRLTHCFISVNSHYLIVFCFFLGGGGGQGGGGDGDKFLGFLGLQALCPTLSKLSEVLNAFFFIRKHAVEISVHYS